MADPKRRIVVGTLQGGRNGDSPAWAIRDDECADAVNVDYYYAPFGRKRGGCTAASFTSSPFTGIVSSAFRHVPTTDDTAAEFWGVDDASPPVVGRVAGGAAFSTPTLKDALTGNGWDVSAVSLNGKLFLAYKSAQGRLHCWDTSTVRRTGLAAPAAAPTAGDTGAGSYAATIRYYRVRYTEQSGGITIRRSEAGASVSFTPSGAGTAARVTKPAAISEGETHWELEASTDDITFYLLATTAVGTTTYDDSADPTTYDDGDVSPLTGTYTLQKSYKFLAADQNRLLGFGSYTSTDKQNRIEISAVIGSLDVGDAERVDTTSTYKIDLDESDSGIAMGLVGPLYGNFYALKQSQIWELTPTGNVSRPYRQTALSKVIGSVGPKAMTVGEDESGNATLYWMSHRGPYRYGPRGIEYIGAGMEDLILGPTSTINLAAAKVTAVTVFYPELRQVWFWFATGSSDDANALIIYDTRTGAWSRFTGGIASARCACLFSTSVGASMSRTLAPYIGQTGANGRIWRTDTGTDDAGTTFQAYIDTKAYEAGSPGHAGEVADAMLLAEAASGVTITATITPDFGAATARTSTALLTAAGSETLVSKRLEDSGFAPLQFVQYRIGDASAVANAWTLHRLVLAFASREAVAA